MTTIEPVPVTYDAIPRLDPAAYERLGLLVVLHRLRDRLLNYGWMQGELWPDQDVPYAEVNNGPTCLAGGLVVALGRTDLIQGAELDKVIDHHPVTVALDDTLASYPDQGRPDPNTVTLGWAGPCANQRAWTEADPGSRLVAWNDAEGRTVGQVIDLIDTTIDRLENQ